MSPRVTWNNNFNLDANETIDIVGTYSFDLGSFNSSDVEIIHIRDDTAGGGYFTVDGVEIPAGITIDFFVDSSQAVGSYNYEFSELYNLEWHAGSSAGTDQLVINTTISGLGRVSDINYAVTQSAPLPDITVTNFSIADGFQFEAGDLINDIDYRIENIGDAAFGSTGTAYVYLSRDATITTSDFLLGSQSFNNVSAGSWDPESESVTLPSSMAEGTWYIGIIADRDNAIHESNENNNTSTPLAIEIITEDTPQAYLTGSPTAVREGDNSQLVEVRLDAPATVTTQVSFEIVGVSGSSSDAATPNIDLSATLSSGGLYSAGPNGEIRGYVQIQAGSDVATIRIHATEDALIETGENFQISLTGVPSGNAVLHSNSSVTQISPSYIEDTTEPESDTLVFPVNNGNTTGYNLTNGLEFGSGHIANDVNHNLGANHDRGHIVNSIGPGRVLLVQENRAGRGGPDYSTTLQPV